MKPVDVVVLNCNSGPLLKKSIANLEKTEHPVRLIVVDNGSVDGSTDFLKDREDILHIRNEKNLGCPEGLNRALPYLKSDYVAFLNEDIFPKPNWLNHIIPLFQDPQVGAVGMKLLKPDGSIEANGSYIYPPLCIASGTQIDVDQPVPVPYTGLGNIVIRRSVFKKVGGFLGKYFLYWDDAEFCIRLWKAGYKVLHQPKAEAIHLHQWSSKRNLPKFLIHHYSIRNGIFTLLLHGTPKEIKTYLPKTLIFRFIETAYSIAIKEKNISTSNLLTFLSIIKNSKWVIKERRQNQNYHKLTLTQIAQKSLQFPSMTERKLFKILKIEVTK